MKFEVVLSAYTLEFEKKELRQAMRAAAKEVAATAQELIRSQTTPSQPGQPPANRTGNLARSITVKAGRGGTSMQITDNAKYATSLETGAKGGGGRNSLGKTNRRNKNKPTTKRVLAPRPFLQTALDKKADSIATRIKQAMLDGVKFQKMK